MEERIEEIFGIRQKFRLIDNKWICVEIMEAEV